MAIIQKKDGKPLHPKGAISIPAWLLPSFRVCYARENNVVNNLLLRLHGGLGDIICAEPAVRFGVENFKGVDFSLATLYPDVFQHLNFKKVFSYGNVHELKIQDYLLYENVDTANELASEFICHALMHGIDYGSLYMWRMLLPREYREIKLVANESQIAHAKAVGDPERDVIIHPGKTWKTRTFPKSWWDTVIARIIEGGGRPVIIGGVIDKGRASTVEVDVPGGALDLRSQQTIMETVALIQQSKVILTNDSSPLHMATTGKETWIGFLSTVKHEDHLLTWRHGQWAWRMQNFAKGTMFHEIDVCPNKDKSVRVDDIDTIELLKWLPNPVDFAEWALWKLEDSSGA